MRLVNLTNAVFFFSANFTSLLTFIILLPLNNPQVVVVLMMISRDLKSQRWYIPNTEDSPSTRVSWLWFNLLLLCPNSLWIKVPMRVQISTSNTEVLHCNGGPVCQDCARTTEPTSLSNTGKATSNTWTISQKQDVWDSHSGIDALCRLFPMRRDWKAELKKPSPGPLMTENQSQIGNLCYLVKLRKVALETHLLFNTTKWTANIAT